MRWERRADVYGKRIRRPWRRAVNRYGHLLSKRSGELHERSTSSRQADGSQLPMEPPKDHGGKADDWLTCLLGFAIEICC